MPRLCSIKEKVEKSSIISFIFQSIILLEFCEETIISTKSESSPTIQDISIKTQKSDNRIQLSLLLSEKLFLALKQVQN